MSVEIVSKGEDFEVKYASRGYGGAQSTAFRVSGDDGVVTAPALKSTAQCADVAVSVAIGAGKAVTVNGIVADSTDGTKSPIGVSVAGGAAGTTIQVITAGEAPGVLSGATPGVRYWLDVAGALTVTKPVTSAHGLFVMGYAKTATTLWVQITDQGLVP